MKPSNVVRIENEERETSYRQNPGDTSPAMARIATEKASSKTISRSHSGCDPITKVGTDLTLASTTPTTIYEKTSLDKDPAQTTSKFQQPREPRMPVLESLGLEGVSIVMGGMVGILGGLSFLTFLWFGHGSQAEAADATWVWRQLALRGYMTQAITLTSLVLCVAVGLQTTVCTSSTLLSKNIFSTPPPPALLLPPRDSVSVVDVLIHPGHSDSLEGALSHMGDDTVGDICIGNSPMCDSC